jgi:hypothetical protein
MGRSTAAYASSALITPSSTISIAPSSDPAVRPIGSNGTAGNTARTQKMANAAEPRATFPTGSIAILLLSDELQSQVEDFLLLAEKKRDKSRKIPIHGLIKNI